MECQVFDCRRESNFAPLWFLEQVQTMEQLQLFETITCDGVTDYVPTLSRATDKATSKLAEQEIAPKLTGLRKQFVDLLKMRGAPSTANEVSAGTESLRKRAKECVDMGFIVSMGVKRCEMTGKFATAYWIAEACKD